MTNAFFYKYLQFLLQAHGHVNTLFSSSNILYTSVFLAMFLLIRPSCKVELLRKSTATFKFDRHLFHFLHRLLQQKLRTLIISSSVICKYFFIVWENFDQLTICTSVRVGRCFVLFTWIATMQSLEQVSALRKYFCLIESSYI